MSVKLEDYKIRSYEGLGTVKVSAYFHVDDLASAKELIEALGALRVGVASTSTSSAEDKKCAPEAPPKAKDEVAAKRAEKKAKTTPAPEKRKDEQRPTMPAEERAPIEPSPESDPDLGGEEDDAPEEPKDEPPTVETAAPSAKPKAKFTPKMTDPDARFTDVVVELHKQGFRDPKDVAAICEKVHEKVPAVKKVKVEELAKRVARVFEIEGLS